MVRRATGRVARRGARRAGGAAWAVRCAGGGGARTRTPASAARRGAWPGWRASSAALGRARAAPSRSRTCALDDPRAARRACRERFGEILRDDRAARVLHAARQVLSRPRAPARGRLRAARRTPSLTPRDHDEVRAVLEACAGAGVAVVPFGGGTSVVGGLEPLRGGFDGARLARPRRARRAGDARRALAAWPSWAPGCARPSSRRALGERGFTLGHYPQSYEYVTIGGCAATRSAGQASTGLRAHRRARGRGARWPRRPATSTCAPQPASAAGPELRRLVVGSEGVLGAITRGGAAGAPGARGHALRGLDVPGASAPAPRRCGAWSRAARRPTSRGSPTRPRRGWGSALAGLRGVPRRRAAAPTCARAAWRGGCLAIVGWAGPDERRARAPRGGRRGAARRAAASLWGSRRGARGCARASTGPTCATTLMDRGVLVETLETATTWAQLFTPLPRGGRRAARARAARRAATSRTCTRRARRCTSPSWRGRGAARSSSSGRAAKAAACEAIVAAGGTITHHHAVGRDHAPYVGAEVGGHRRGRAARPEARARSGRDHEPRQAAAGGLAAGGVLDRPAQVDRAGRRRVRLGFSRVITRSL